jgi:hypothetical protein
MPKVKTGRAPNPSKVVPAPKKKPAQYVPPVPSPPPTTIVPNAPRPSSSTIAPSSSVPSTPTSTTSPGLLNPVVTEGSLEEATAKLNAEKRKAARLGVQLVSPLPTSTSSSSTGTTGYLNPIPEAKSDKGGGGFLSQAIGLLQLGTRASASLVKEASDLFNSGDASFTDVWDQFADPEYGYGKAFPEPLGIKNKWIAYPLHFALDIGLDPTTYLTFGGSAVAKTIVRGGIQVATKEVAQAAGKKVVSEIGQESVEALAKKVGRDTAESFVANVAEVNAAKAAREAAQQGVSNASDDILREAAEQTLLDADIVLRNADKAFQESLIETSIKLGGKGGTILSKEVSRQAAHEAWVQSVGTAGEKAAKKTLDKATEDLATSAIFRGSARRAYGRTASLDLADTARLVRDEALGVATDATVSVARREAAQKIVNDLSDDVIADIAKRGYQAIAKDVASALGTTGKTRFGIGSASTFLPGGITPVSQAKKLVFRGLNKARLGVIASGPGREIAELLTPLGRAGIFNDPKKAASLKAALRTGTIGGRKLDSEEAVDYVSLLAANNEYLFLRRAAVANRTTAAKNVLVGTSKKDRNAVQRALEAQGRNRAAGFATTPTERAARAADQKIIDDLTDDQKALFTKVEDFFAEQRSGAYDELLDAGGTASFSLNRGIFGTPIIKSAQAENWLRLNPSRANELAKGLNIDVPTITADIFEDSLRPGAKLFGRVLTAEDIAGGVTRLNQIARDAGKLNFDLFETDLGNIISKFAEKSGELEAFSRTVKLLTDEGRLARQASRTVVAKDGKEALKEIKPALEGLSDILNDVFRLPPGVTIANMTQKELESFANPITRWTPNEINEIQSSLQRISIIVQNAGNPSGTNVESLDELLELIEGVSRRADEINKAVLEGNDYRVGALFKLESIDELKKSIDNTLYDIGVTADIFLERLVDPQFINQNWSQLTRTFDDGFTALAGGPWRNIPDVRVKNAIQEIFDNVSEINKTGVAKNFGAFVNTFNNFFKSWMTASPGFHVRNSIGNAFALFAAGTNPINGSRMTNYLNQYLIQNRNKLRGSAEFVTPEQFVGSLKKVSQPERDNILQSLLIVDDIQGQVAESISGGRVGIFGKAATGNIPGSGLPLVGGALRPLQRALDATGVSSAARVASQAGGLPLGASRTVGTWIENNARVILMYDGLQKGLSPQEALTRVNKYLFDYQDLSAADQVLKNIIPFWLWGSRNFPLVVENMFTNPKAYKTYQSFERNFIEDDENLPGIFGEGGMYYPKSLKDAGTGVIREGLPGAGRIFPVDLGFPGASRPTIFTKAIELAVPGGPGDTRDLLQTFAGQSPYAALIEYMTGTDLYFDRKDTDPAASFLGSAIPPASRLGDLAEIFGLSTDDPGLQKLFGLPQKEKTNRTKALEQFLGTPYLIGREPRESDALSEIFRQLYEQKARNEAAAKE